MKYSIILITKEGHRHVVSDDPSIANNAPEGLQKYLLRHYLVHGSSEGLEDEESKVLICDRTGKRIWKEGDIQTNGMLEGTFKVELIEEYEQKEDPVAAAYRKEIENILCAPGTEYSRVYKAFHRGIAIGKEQK